jgi:DNA-binding NarL/FixJ family response regulator
VTVLACALEASGADAEARLWRESVAVGSTADPVLRRLVVSKAGEPPTTPEGRSRARRPLVVLTAKEREIGALLVEGATNAAIAEQLAVSRRTVEYHVSNLYAKSGVRTRTALAAWLRQAQEHPPGS